MKKSSSPPVSSSQGRRLLVGSLIVLVCLLWGAYLHSHQVSSVSNTHRDTQTDIHTESHINQIDVTNIDKKNEDIPSNAHTAPDNKPKEQILFKRTDSFLAHLLADNRLPVSHTIQQSQVVEMSQDLPVLGPVPTEGVVPLYGMQHNGASDAVFALACNYPKIFYQRFVGSLRKSGFKGDIVLAVSPPNKIKRAVAEYVKKMEVVAYGFDVDCVGKDNCRLKDDFLGYPDPRPHRTFANIRYALYEYWLRFYSEKSHILILDFRDTFFQADPFLPFGSFESRPSPPPFTLHVFAENAKVKNIGNCVFNSLWIGRCFGKDALEQLRPYPVLCSGSTLGSYGAIKHYIRTMLQSMDTVKCWLKGIESDQGYQNYLFYMGYLNSPDGKVNATLNLQGEGVVNTIGAMNGFRVPKEMVGSLESYWHIRDPEGFILNNDGNRSACIHQWDRWYKDLRKFVDTKTF